MAAGNPGQGNAPPPATPPTVPVGAFEIEEGVGFDG
jgi:hypothetical protein